MTIPNHDNRRHRSWCSSSSIMVIVIINHGVPHQSSRHIAARADSTIKKTNESQRDKRPRNKKEPLWRPFRRPFPRLFGRLLRESGLHLSAACQPPPSTAAPPTQSNTKNSCGLSLPQKILRVREIRKKYINSSGIAPLKSPTLPTRLRLYLFLALPPLLQLTASTRKKKHKK